MHVLISGPAMPLLCLPAVQLPGGAEASMRCRPYNVSPLQLLAPPTHAVSPAEFYQLWQALPHRAQVGCGGEVGSRACCCSMEGGLN